MCVPYYTNNLCLCNGWVQSINSIIQLATISLILQFPWTITLVIFKYFSEAFHQVISILFGKDHWPFKLHHIIKDSIICHDNKVVTLQSKKATGSVIPELTGEDNYFWYIFNKLHIRHLNTHFLWRWTANSLLGSLVTPSLIISIPINMPCPLHRHTKFC